VVLDGEDKEDTSGKKNGTISPYANEESLRAELGSSAFSYKYQAGSRNQINTNGTGTSHVSAATYEDEDDEEESEEEDDSQLGEDETGIKASVVCLPSEAAKVETASITNISKRSFEEGKGNVFP